MKEEKKYTIKHSEKTKDIFNEYINLSLVKEKLMKIKRELVMIEKEAEYVSSRFWNLTENYLGIANKEVGMTIDVDESSMDKLVIKETEMPDLPNYFSDFLKMLKGK